MQKFQFSMLPLGGQVDKDEGLVRGVSVITSGVEARGHKLFVDQTTLLQMQECGENKGKVPVKWNHRSGADAVAGYLFNFRVDGDKLKADWQLLKKHERYEQALEMMELMPDGVGLSAVFRGESTSKGNKKFARCRELQCVDLVASPAANPDGMFSEVDIPTGDMSKTANPPTNGGETEVSLSQIMAAITAVGQRLEGVEQFQSQVQDAMEFEEQQELAGGQAHAFEQAGGSDDPIHAFHAALDEVEGEREHQFNTQAEADLADKVESLLELNEGLADQNRAMSEALEQLTGSPVEFSVVEGGESTVAFAEVDESGQEVHAFTARVNELVADGKTEGEAVEFAVDENPSHHQDYMEHLGASV